MKKRLVALTLIVIVLLGHISGIPMRAKESFVPLNPVIDVGDKLYVQHDEENNNVYDLKKSGTGVTTVYETILAEFTANKAWTTDGVYMENVSKKADGNLTPHGATAPEDYIPVKEGEEYFIKTYGVGYTKDSAGTVYYYAPVLFMDSKDQVVSDALTNTMSKSKSGVTITVPKGATKMHLTMYNHQNFTLQRVLHLTDKAFDKLPVNRADLEQQIEKNYEQYKKDPTVYEKPDKAYITFVNDDTRSPMDQFADLFIEKKVPLVLATVPNELIENASSEKETRLQVARRVEQAGGEIIAHNGGVLTQEGFSDYNTMYSFFVRTKQLFNAYDLDVNGIILAGGTGQVTGAEESERWASSFYSYSDLYGVEYDKKEIALDSVYYHRRGGLGNYKNDLEKIKQSIDDAIEEKNWTVFYFHDANEISLSVLGQVLDYVNAKSGKELEVVTYKEMYQKYARKESKLINTKKTYYVSATGTSASGTSKKEPMSYETAKKKVYKTGDTVLFKRGDTFYGTFQPSIVKVDESVLTISAYGEGELPKISGYKVVASKNAWQLHAGGIYKIDLTDTSAFSGLQTTDANSNNIGFLEDTKGKKYFNKKSNLDELQEEYDFTCDDTWLYLKCEENPYEKLGELKLATRTNLLLTSSNLKVSNLCLSGTGAHGMVNAASKVQNVEISGNVIEDIGGSYLQGTTRYGNGIEFYGADVSDVCVIDNIIRNVYDVGFTMQGTQGSGKNVVVKGNAFVNNSQDSEIWENGTATGIESYEFTNNISVNAGRGWGYDARPDKYGAAHILFWGYLIENTDIYFHHNIVYHPRRVYFVEQSNGTNVFFKEQEKIRSDYNTYYLSEDATIFRDSYKIAEKDAFLVEYKKDAHSTFVELKADEKVLTVCAQTHEISQIKKLFGYEETKDSNEPKIYKVSFNVKGTVPLQQKKSTTAIRVMVEKGDQVVSYQSSNKKVAIVDKKGKITGKKTGVAKITVTTKKGATASIRIKVQKGTVKTKKLSVSKKTLTLKKGKTYALQVSKTPVTSLEKVTYGTSNKKVATVNKKGKITAGKPGKATITIKCGEKKVCVKVVVKG